MQHFNGANIWENNKALDLWPFMREMVTGVFPLQIVNNAEMLSMP